MWQTGKKYTFIPSGDADELILQVVSPASMTVAKRWYTEMYQRPFNLTSATRAYKTLLLSRGRDGVHRHNKGDTYFVFDCDFKDAEDITDQFLSPTEKAKIRYNALGGYTV